MNACKDCGRQISCGDYCIKHIVDANGNERKTAEQIAKEHKIEQLKIKIAEFKQMQQIHEKQMNNLLGASK
jgi:hypothetical protein